MSLKHVSSSSLFLPFQEEDNGASEMSTSDTQNTILPTEGGNEGVSVKHFLSPKKRAKRSKPKSPYSKREEEAYISLQQAMKKDVCTTYGEHVGNELRALYPRARTIVKHLINNILFEAAMGKYNEKLPTSHDWNIVTTSSSATSCVSRPPSLQSSIVD
ncbi:hypothetical protein J6590_107625, partial [Homalodisca vitripennis]